MPQSPTAHLRRLLSLLAVVGLLAALPACDSGEDDPDDEVPDFNPSFSVSSTGVTLDGNRDGLQFFATPDVNVEITEVLIRNPVGNQEQFNGNNDVFLANRAFALQNANEGYFRFSGDWSFEFRGRSAEDASRQFNVTVIEDVSNFAPGDPVETE
jgi:hypothetical protein